MEGYIHRKVSIGYILYSYCYKWIGFIITMEGAEDRVLFYFGRADTDHCRAQLERDRIAIGGIQIGVGLVPVFENNTFELYGHSG